MASRIWSALILAGFVGFTPAEALADDDEVIFDLDDDEDEDPPPERLKEGDSEDVDEGDPDEESEPATPATGTTGETGSGLLDVDDDDDEEDDAPMGQLKPGEDNASLYRAKLSEVEGMSADEESMSWEEYLDKYPASVFRKVIQERQEVLSDALYSEGGPSQQVDAGKAELNFAQGILMEPIDPRSRIRAGFTWGFPNWINLLFDYEHQLQRNMSVHGGMQRRAGGWNIEGGVRYAFIKETRTNFILTGIGDVHLNVNPIAPGIRPQIAAGKRFAAGKTGHIDLQAQVGPDLMFYSAEISPRIAGGLNLTVAPSETVEAFLEINSYMKDMGWSDGNAFQFNQLAFGIRFMGKRDPNSGSQMSGGAGAAVPVSTNYWKHHYGAVIGDYNFYL